MADCPISGRVVLLVGLSYCSMSAIGILFQLQFVLYKSYFKFFMNYFCYFFITTLLPFVNIALLFIGVAKARHILVLNKL